jgi:hypothetical protein
MQPAKNLYIHLFDYQEQVHALCWNEAWWCSACARFPEPHGVRLRLVVPTRSQLNPFPEQAMISSLCLWLTLLPLQAQQHVTLRETLQPGTQYSVSCRVEVSGTLTLAPEKGQSTAKSLKVSGNSALDYQERVLALGKDQQVDRTIRLYRKLEFQRTVGDQQQQSTLRPAVRRLVILRHNQVEVPFSPDGPMTWNELDMIRTDVFSPALVGLLPPQAVGIGQTWDATTTAVQELTDLEKVEGGSVTCKLDQLQVLGGRPHARITFSGAVRGVGEDGPTRHAVDGYLLFDRESNHIAYVSMRGLQHLVDKEGKTAGSVEGTFTMTRRPEAVKELADQALQGLKLEPNEDNTQLLYDNPELGVKFLHPRRWRVAGVRGPQVAIDENSGHGMLLTVDQLKQVPTAAQFLQESKTFLEKQKAKILRIEQPKQLQATPKTIEQFSMEVETGGQRFLMVYLVLRQGKTGATIAARVLPAQQAVILQDIERIARSVEMP